MAVTFILGRAGAGKTRFCLEAIRAELSRPAGRPLILLVPEQASFQMERLLATGAPHRGYTRAAVLSFSRLASRVFAETGGEPDQISSAARGMALRLVARRLGSSLRLYRGALPFGGFYAQLEELVAELLREQVGPDDLLRAAGRAPDPGTRRKLTELAELYRAYLAWLGGGRLDPAQRLAELRRRLAAVPWLAQAGVWVDGFAGFTGQELTTLAALAQTAGELAITLLLDPNSPAVQRAAAPDPLGLFRRTELTFARLSQLFAAAGVPCRPPVRLQAAPLPRFTIAPALARLEAGLAVPLTSAAPSPAGPALGPADEIALLECATHRDELQAAARFIREKISESGGRLHYRDFAIIARDLEPLAPLVAEVFAEYDLPYFLDRRRPMRGHPLCRLVEALLAAVLEEFSVPAATRLLRTGLLPLSRSQAEQLENVVVAHAVRGVAAWREPVWDFSGDHLGETPAEPPQPTSPTALDTARQRLVDAVKPLLELAAADPPASGAAWARGIYQTLEALGVRKRLADWIAETRAERGWERAETHRLAWEALTAVLDDLFATLGGQPLAAADVAAILAGALAAQTLGLAPPALDQVLISAIERSRHPDVRYAWVVAFNEGIFPARPPEDELLAEDERALLGGALAGSGAGAADRPGGSSEVVAPALPGQRERALDERLLGYIALTRPSCGLTISFARTAEDGTELQPSPWLDEIQRCWPGLTPRPPDESAPPVCLHELARRYLALRARDSDRPRAAARYERLRQELACAPAGERLMWLLRGTTYTNRPEVLGRFRPVPAEDVAWAGSPSELETYLDCPFKHFAQYGLQLDPSRGPRPLSWDLGVAAHRILAAITRGAMQERGGVRRITPQRWMALLDAAFYDFLRQFPPDLARRRPELWFQAGQLRPFLEEVVTVHGARWRRGRFAPLACEQPFGAETRRAARPQPAGAPPSWPAVELRLAEGARVLLRGVIDRVDACTERGHTWLLVYDYKSTAGPLGGEFLTGARLQLFTYLLACAASPPAREGAAVAGVFLAPLYPNCAALDTKQVAAAPPEEQPLWLYRPRGLFLREVARLLDEQLGTTASPVAYMRLRHDGDFDRAQSRDVISADQLVQWLELARRTLRQTAAALARGELSAGPLVEGRLLSCRWCDFAPLCRFDRVFNQARAAEAALPTLARLSGTPAGAGP